MNLAARLADYAWLARAQLRPGTPDWSGGPGAPVLLVPGIWETWHVMRGLGDALHRAGHPVHGLDLGTNSADLASSADRLCARLDALDLRHAVAVAHSKGGLVAKLALGRTDRLDGAVALATPFAGSRYATWFPARPVRRLSPRDPEVRALAADATRHARIVAFRPRYDPHVPRGATGATTGAAALTGAVEVEVDLEGHFRLLGDPGVQAAVVRAVEGFGAGR